MNWFFRSSSQLEVFKSWLYSNFYLSVVTSFQTSFYEIVWISFLLQLPTFSICTVELAYLTCGKSTQFLQFKKRIYLIILKITDLLASYLILQRYLTTCFITTFYIKWNPFLAANSMGLLKADPLWLIL